MLNANDKENLVKSSQTANLLVQDLRDPFKISGPVCISFSGGRTSAYMLWRVLESNGGALPPETEVCFANTGKEDEATLRFVRDCSAHWKVPITWLEYRAGCAFEVVTFDTASRNGEPFEALIYKRNYLPNPVTRFCTAELKVLTIERYLKARGWQEWDSLIGVRADEPARVAKMRANPSGGRSGVERLVPLADAGVTAEMVGAFWRSHPFDLNLPNVGGKTLHGNCDLCFLKGAGQVLSLIAEKPERAVWWAKMEDSISTPGIRNGALWRADRPSYAAMAKFAAAQLDMFSQLQEEAIACYCGD